ncbi:hypothetical protein Aperf_G00000120693 [Anoplocephala perfoliata]
MLFRLIIIAIFVFQYSSALSDVEDSAILERKINGLTSYLDNSHVIRLDYEKYKEYLVRPPRNYSVILMLTALKDRHSCHHCQSAADEFYILVNAFYKSNIDKTRLFFAVADYDDDPKIFTSLNQNTVPVYLHFPPNMSPQKKDFYDITQNGFSAEVLAQWIFARTEIHLKIERPPSYSGLIFIVIAAGVIGIIIYLRSDNIGNLASRSTVSFTCMVVIFYLISGQVWNNIQRPAAFHNSAERGLVIFYPSSSSQFVWETVIIMGVYALMSWGLIILTEVDQTQDPNRKRVMAIIGLAMFVISISLSLSFFRKKNHGYPFSFLLK